MSFAEDTCSGPIIGEKCPSDYHHSLYLINPNITNRSFLSSSPRSQSVTVSSKCIQSTQMSLIVPFWAVYLFLSDLSPPRCYIHLRWSCCLSWFWLPPTCLRRNEKIAKAIIVVRSARVDKGISYLLTRFANLQWGGATATALMMIVMNCDEKWYLSTLKTSLREQISKMNSNSLHQVLQMKNHGSQIKRLKYITSFRSRKYLASVRSRFRSKIR